MKYNCFTYLIDHQLRLSCKNKNKKHICILNAWDALTVRGDFRTHPPVGVFIVTSWGNYV